MKATELSKYKRDRFSKNRTCIICGQPIADNEELEYEVHKYGHWKKYFFMHGRCYFGAHEKSTQQVERHIPQ